MQRNGEDTGEGVKPLGQKVGSRPDLVADGVMHVEDVDSIITDGEYDAKLVLLPPAIAQLADFFGEFGVLRSDRAA